MNTRSHRVRSGAGTRLWTGGKRGLRPGVFTFEPKPIGPNGTGRRIDLWPALFGRSNPIDTLVR
jgi:hypothetical protein